MKTINDTECICLWTGQAVDMTELGKASVRGCCVRADGSGHGHVQRGRLCGRTYNGDARVDWECSRGSAGRPAGTWVWISADARVGIGSPLTPLLPALHWNARQSVSKEY